MNVQRGRLITLEGSEGAGKSTQLQSVCEALESRKIAVYRTREPGGTGLAEQIRDLLLAPRADEAVHGLTETLLVFAARKQHIDQEIEPRLASGQWVVCDRFTDATYAYQGAGRGVQVDVIAYLEAAVQGSLRPDLILYLDLPPSVGAERISGRPADRLEQEQADFFQAVRQGYLDRAHGNPAMRVIDASGSVHQVREAVLSAIGAFLRAHPP